MIGSRVCVGKFDDRVEHEPSREICWKFYVAGPMREFAAAICCTGSATAPMRQFACFKMYAQINVNGWLTLMAAEPADPMWLT